MPKNWLPLESNPDVINDYVAKMGLDVSTLAFHDLMSTEDWALGMIPRPVLAVVMLFPIKKATEEYRRAEAERIQRDGQVCSKSVYYMKQTVGNACGTVGILHAIGNARRHALCGIKAGSYLDTFYTATGAMTPEEIAAYLEQDETIEEIHASAAVEGQSEAPAEDEDVDTHFVCFSMVEGQLYELDGRKTAPINHGECSEETMLERATEVVKGFMARDPDEVRFTIMALASAEGGEEG
jgi:ubiquitin carboxyl-terminal hydrolase L3